MVTDACGGRDEAAIERALAGLGFAGDAIFTDVATISRLFRKSAVDPVPQQRNIDTHQAVV